MVSSMAEEQPGRLDAVEDTDARNAVSEHAIERAMQLGCSLEGCRQKLPVHRAKLLKALTSLSGQKGSKFCELVASLAASANENIYDVSDEQLLRAVNSQAMLESRPTPISK